MPRSGGGRAGTQNEAGPDRFGRASGQSRTRGLGGSDGLYAPPRGDKRHLILIVLLTLTLILIVLLTLTLTLIVLLTLTLTLLLTLSALLTLSMLLILIELLALVLVWT